MLFRSGPLGKKYQEFCTNFLLKQLIKTPTRITSNSLSLIDHVLTHSSVKISNSGVVDTTLSDHQLIFCTRKLARIKLNINERINCWSTKTYASEKFQN